MTALAKAQREVEQTRERLNRAWQSDERWRAYLAHATALERLRALQEPRVASL